MTTLVINTQNASQTWKEIIRQVEVLEEGLGKAVLNGK